MARSYARQRTNTQPVPDTRLQGRRLVIARVIWAMLIVLNLVMFALMLPAYFTQLQTVCTAPVCAPVQPAIDTARALQAHSLTIASYAIFTFILMLTIALACCIVGAVIFWRRSNDWMALLVALVLTMVGNVYVTYSLQQSHSAWQWPAFHLNTIIFTIIFLFFGLFPDGRFVPRWARWITVAWIGWGIVFPFFSHLSFSIMLDNLVWLCLYGCSVVAQILRYLSMSDSVHRQQIKWIVFGMCLTMIAVVGLRAPAIVYPSLGPGSLYDLASGPGLMLAMIPFLLSAPARVVLCQGITSAPAEHHALSQWRPAHTHYGRYRYARPDAGAHPYSNAFNLYGGRRLAHLSWRLLRTPGDMYRSCRDRCWCRASSPDGASRAKVRCAVRGGTGRGAHAVCRGFRGPTRNRVLSSRAYGQAASGPGADTS